MSAPRIERALIVWGACSLVLGLAGGFNRAANPLLERHRTPRTMAYSPRQRLTQARDEAAGNRASALRQIASARVVDSLRVTKGPASFDVRLPLDTATREVTQALRRYWGAVAVEPPAIPVTIAVRDAGRSGTSVVARVDSTGCRTVIWLGAEPGPHGVRRHTLDVRMEQRMLGACLFAARYGVPGRAASDLMPRAQQSLLAPCFLRASLVLTYWCRSNMRVGSTLPGTTDALGPFGYSGGVTRLACGAGRPGACARWAAELAKNAFGSTWEARWRLPALERDLRPEAFGNFWRDARSVAEAYQAASGRPYLEYLRTWAVPADAEYAPGPTLRARETLIALLVIAIALGAVIASSARRTSA